MQEAYCYNSSKCYNVKPIITLFACFLGYQNNVKPIGTHRLLLKHYWFSLLDEQSFSVIIRPIVGFFSYPRLIVILGDS